MHTNMHINSNSSPPFCQSSTKGLKIKQNKKKSRDVLPLLSKLKYDTNLKVKLYQLKNTNLDTN